MTFKEYHFKSYINEALNSINFVNPTKVQEIVIPEAIVLGAVNDSILFDIPALSIFATEHPLEITKFSIGNVFNDEQL